MDAARIKWIVLCSLCLQNCIYTMGRKYSIKFEGASSTEILLMGEVIKLVACGYVSSGANAEDSIAPGVGYDRLLWLAKNSSPMLIISVVYGIMNILSFVALWYIGSGEFIVIAQLKILATACASGLFLDRWVSYAKWRALFLLVIGCCIVSTSNMKDAHGSEEVLLRLLGYGLTAIEVLLSGLNSVYFEKVVKSSVDRLTIWERNFQLAIYGTMLYASIVTYNVVSPKFGSEDKEWGSVLKNWTLFTWFVAFLAALGGLLVAATLKYADAILKTLAAAGAIILSNMLGPVLLNESWSLNILFGSLVVIIAIFNYTLDKDTTSTVASHGSNGKLSDPLPSLTAVAVGNESNTKFTPHDAA